MPMKRFKHDRLPLKKILYIYYSKLGRFGERKTFTQIHPLKVAYTLKGNIHEESKWYLERGDNKIENELLEYNKVTTQKFLAQGNKTKF